MNSRHFISTLSEKTKRPRTKRKRLVLLGGFLGAGKTSSMGAAVQFLLARGLRPGLVTNDQGVGLVDTELGKTFSRAESGSQVKQVTGGCFCCRVDDLVKALTELEQECRPDVFVVEPVGSCTDLMATVMLPLREVYQSDFELAPMSVVVDGRTIRDLGFRAGRRKGWERHDKRMRGFSKGVDYIFRKQLEEAEILVVNKVDLLTVAQRRKVREWLETEFPEKRVFEVSTRTGEGLEAWFEVLMRETSQPKALMEVDYDVYAEGEALLGWYNASLSVHALGNDLDGNKWLLGLARAIQGKLEAAGAELAHFKLSLRGHPILHQERKEDKTMNAEGCSGDGKPAASAGEVNAGALAVVNVVRNGTKAELSVKMEGKIVVGELLVNLRAEGAPELMAKTVGDSLNGPNMDARLVWKEKAAFRPGRPQPVHRITELKAK